MRTITKVLVVSLGTFASVAAPAMSQDAEVRGAVERTFAALNARRLTELRSYVMPRAQLFVYFGYGTTLREGVDSTAPEAWRAPFEGVQFDLMPRDIRVQVYGNTAVVAAYVHGTVRFSSGLVEGGPWRYSETRIRNEGEWKIVQQHFSPLGERAVRVADLGFRRLPAVDHPAYPTRSGPTVLIDEAHFNLHTAWGSYRPLAEFLRRDGYVVRESALPFSLEGLRSAGVLIISTAMSENLVGNQGAAPRPAFTADEVAAVRDWVQAGGSLLLITNHNPFAAAVQDLAAAFGIRVSNCGATHPMVGSGRLMFRRSSGGATEYAVLDTLIARADTAAAQVILQRMVTRTRDGMSYGPGGTLVEHPVTAGIDSVATFLGAAFRVDGPHQPLLVFGSGVACFDQTSLVSWVRGHLQGALLEVGNGRVAVFGEAGMFTAQVVGFGGTKMGWNNPIAPQNAQLVLNVMHWLTRLGEPR